MTIELLQETNQFDDSALSQPGDQEIEKHSEKYTPRSLLTLRQIAFFLLQFQFVITAIYLVVLSSKIRSYFLTDFPTILASPIPTFTKQYIDIVHLSYFAGVPLTLSIAMAIAVRALRMSRFPMEKLFLVVLITLSIIDSFGLMKMLAAILQ